MCTRTALILLLLPKLLALSLRAHHLSHPANHQWYVGQVFQTFQLIGIVVVMIGIGACCFYFRGCFTAQERAQETVVVQNNQRSQDNRVAAQPQRRMEPEVYEEPPEPKNNAILDYFNSQKGDPVATRPAEHIKQSTSPYLTNKIAGSAFPKWEPTTSPITSCAVCSLFNKGNEIPMVQAECQDDHCFHIACLSQYRAKMTLDFGGNGLNKCPKCKQTYSPLVRIFCPSCKRSAVSVNLVDFTDQETGEIATQQIVAKYGPGCQNCREQ